MMLLTFKVDIPIATSLIKTLHTEQADQIFVLVAITFLGRVIKEIIELGA